MFKTLELRDLELTLCFYSDESVVVMMCPEPRVFIILTVLNPDYKFQRGSLTKKGEKENVTFIT